MLEINKIYNLDCIEGIKQLDTRCVDLVVSSPPYPMADMWNEKNEREDSKADKLFELSSKCLI